MADSEKKALDFIAQAEKKLKTSSGFMNSLMGGSSKVEDAAELYQKAGHLLKIAKKWEEAGNAYGQSAAIHLKLNNRLEVATQYIDCAMCYKKVDREACVNYLLKAIEIYIDMGRFTIAAKHHMEIAEAFETDPADLAQSMSHYQKAADFYHGEESNSSANRCLLKVAQFAGQLEMYDRAADIYEKIGQYSMENALLRHGAKDHFFRAAICKILQDAQDGENSLVKYESTCPSFGESRECKMLRKLLSAINENDEEAFTVSAREFDSISRLDQWCITMLARLKKSVQSESDLC